MKILAIGDPHGSEKIRKIPIKKINPDLILLPGDLGKSDLIRKMAFENIDRKKQGLPEKKYSASMKKRGYMEVYNSSMKLIKYLSKFAPIYLIYGNADYYNKDVRKLSKEINQKLPFMYNDLNSINNVRIINNRIANFKGIRIGGLEYFIDTSWVREFKPADYKERIRKAKKETDKARRIIRNFRYVDILLCHQPPYRVLDKKGPGGPKDWEGKHAGSKVVLDYIKKERPRYVLCGHMHEAKGKEKIGNTEVFNLGCCGDYKVLNLHVK